MSETGELVNIDGTGNRVSADPLWTGKIYFIVGSNKIEPDLARAMERAKNGGAPKTPAASVRLRRVRLRGSLAMTAAAQERICQSTVIIERPSNGMEAEIVFVDEALGY